MNSTDSTTIIDPTKREEFTLDYDKLVISVGAYSKTFGIPGVKEYACFLKEVNDARKIRQRLIDCNVSYIFLLLKMTSGVMLIRKMRFFLGGLGFEYASQPGISDKEKEERLHFVVVGGGPTVSLIC